MGERGILHPYDLYYCVQYYNSEDDDAFEFFMTFRSTLQSTLF